MPSKKRQNSEEVDAREHKRARTEEDGVNKRAVTERSTPRTPSPTGGTKRKATDEKSAGKAPPRTPSPSAGTKRASTDLKVSDDSKPGRAPDTKAIYKANQAEIDKWYDEDFSQKQGIPIGGRVLKSNHSWFQKVNAWMKMKGLLQPPKKKRKLNDGSRVTADNHKLKPHQVRYPKDLANVPEYPNDKLSDYSLRPNGLYACSHVLLDPPRDCCTNGMDSRSKRASIRKDVDRWRGKIEKMIEKGELDARHKTWQKWRVPELRQKYQPKLWQQREDKKKADRENRERKDQRMKERQEEMERASVRQAAREQAAQITTEQRSRPRPVPAPQGQAEARPVPVRQSAHQELVKQPRVPRPEPVPAPQRHPSARPAPANATLVVPALARPSAPGPSTRPIAPMHRRSDPKIILSAQAAFLTGLARTNPRLLRSHQALYRDAQYRENTKERPDFALLRTWYLAYFLQQQRQPLTGEQTALLGSGDPSQSGRKRFGGAPGLGSVDELFGEYWDARRTSVVSVERRGEQGNEEPKRQAVLMPVAHGEASVEAETYGFEETDVAPLVDLAELLEEENPFTWLSPGALDREIDRILDLAPAQTTQASTLTAGSVPKCTPALRPETSYLTTLPRGFATGNQDVDGGMQRLLGYAYQTEPMPSQSISEDEALLRQSIEGGRLDWQRYCDFYSGDQFDQQLHGVIIADGQSQSTPTQVQGPAHDDWDFGEPPSEK